MHRRGSSDLNNSFNLAIANAIAYYNFNDSSTLYQESTGNTAASAVTDPLGLVLDKSQGLVLGSELVTNGDFATDSDWTKDAGVTISGGVASFSSVASGDGLQQVLSGISVGDWCEVTFDVSNWSSRDLSVRVGSGGGFVTITGSNGSKRLIYRVQGSTTLQVFSSFAGGTFDVDNISVKALPGNHASQSTSGSRLAYGIQPKEGVRNLLTNSDTMSTQNVETSAVQYTLSIKGTGSVTLSGTSTDGPLNGTGASDIVSLTFTPTAGTLTLTVSGTVTEAQLEKGSSRSTYQSVGAWYNVQQGTVTADNHVYLGGFDQIDDHLTAAAGGGGTTGIFLAAAVRAPAAGTAATIWSDRGTNTGYRLSIDSSNQVQLSAGNGSTYTTVTGDTLTAQELYVIIAWHDGTNLNIQVNGGTTAQAAFGTATAGTAGFTIGKDNGASSGYWGRGAFALLYTKNDSSSAATRETVRRYLSQQIGVTA